MLYFFSEMFLRALIFACSSVDLPSLQKYDRLNKCKDLSAKARTRNIIRYVYSYRIQSVALKSVTISLWTDIS